MHAGDNFDILPKLGEGLERITMALFGGNATGSRNDTLTMDGSGPFSFDGTFRRYAFLSSIHSKLWMLTKYV